MLRQLHIYLKLLLIAVFSLSVSQSMADNKKFTVVIDAGHGGKDIGAIDNGVMEKNINLKVAKQLENLIKKKMKNTSVVMTRDNDTYLTLQHRADKANKSHGDIFISIHTNSVDKRNKNRKNIEGSSVYTLGLHKDENNLEVAMRENSVIELETDYEQKYSGFDPQRDESYIIFEMAQKKNLSQSIKLAESIEKELVKSGRKERGVHQAGFWVLWATSMPSVLVELDFICNPKSASYISSDKGAKELAEAIFKAIQAYEKTWNKLNRQNNSDELSSTYLDDSEGNLEDTYILSNTSTVAKTRKRTLSPSGNSPVKSDKRRRRSAHSRELSLNRSFETENLVFPGLKTYSTMEETAPVELLAMNSGDSKAKSKNKKQEKKKKEKESKNKQQSGSKVRKEDAHNAKVNKLITVYKIQILASADLLGQDNSRFCGLSPVTAYKENNLYKYYYGESTDKAEIETVLADVRKKIPDAFIVTSQKSMQTKNK